MEWTPDTKFKFLDFLEDEPIIWNPKRNCIKTEMQGLRPGIDSKKKPEFSINELKKKREALFSIYRHVRTKYIKSKKPGSGLSEIEQPSCFAFKKLDCFSRDVYQPKISMNTKYHKNLLKCNDSSSNYY